MHPLTFSLHEAIWLMDSIANRLLKSRYDISFAKFYVLAILSKCEPTSQANLAACMGQSAAAVSKSLAFLEEEGLITSEVDPEQKRKNLVCLTSKGRDMVARCTEFLELAFLERLADSGVDIERYRRDTQAIKERLLSFNQELTSPAN